MSEMENGEREMERKKEKDLNSFHFPLLHYVQTEPKLWILWAATQLLALSGNFMGRLLTSKETDSMGLGRVRKGAVGK